MGQENATKTPARWGLGDALFDPKEKAKVDIVFVHGLNGDRFDTWTWKDKYSKQFWPQTLLPKDCPTARIMSFGYNSSITHFYPSGGKTVAPELTVDDHSKSLFQALVGLRDETSSKDRPIIFVSHSLGGLVVANALSRAHDSEAAKEISNHTIGTLFLGTPFQGSDFAKYGRLAARLLEYFTDTQTDNLETLKKHSVKIVAINDAFAKYLKERDRTKEMPYLEVACFFEERKLKKFGKDIGFIVPKESASWLGTDALPISKNHMDMCRFEDEDETDYKNVAAKLREWVANSDKPRPAGTSGVGGINAQSIGVIQSGSVDYSNSTISGGVQAGHLYGTTSNANVLTGTVNHNYAPGTKP
ncbi:hypothetical protein JX265_005222 [Neoarthrinium moseri]|uniref:DUF676 domain-containing protein n=1 Tax=Neoarthrinium moseri TaxID=1658444 RepID=A0A9P9WPA7_9PEZI|nr:hypothetical protein JX265_005222 [Neoarthrinium moseri]